MDKVWYIQPIEYYSTLKRVEKTLSSYEKTWRKLKCVALLSGRSEFEKATNGMTFWKR